MTIPFNDIKIDPKMLKSKLINKIDNIDINDIVKKIVRKEINDILDSNHFWYEITGTNICAYKYQFSKKKEGHICGKPIHRKNKDIKYGNFLCSRHLDKHEVERPRQLKDNQIQCKATTIANTQCLYSSKIDGYCVQHYKCINKIDTNKIHRLIKNKKEKNIQEVQNKPTIELLEIVGGNLNNSDSSRNSENIKVYENVCAKTFLNNNINSTTIGTSNKTTNSNNNSNIINIAKNAKSLEKLENNFISNYITNTNNKLQELNRKIIENTSIIEKLKKYYTKIEYRKCEEKYCNNCKSYNIIYNTNCIDHIHNRHKPPMPNFFKSKISPLPPS